LGGSSENLAENISQASVDTGFFLGDDWEKGSSGKRDRHF
jgi:hypothetical protein